jgi:DNA repair exonuclease SbcCD ATPase subunit
MVLKHVKSKTAQNELMGAIDMKQYVDEIEEIMYSKYGETLEKRDETIEELTEELATMNRKLDNKNQELNTKNKELNKLKKEINELCKLEDLNSPKARKILNSMILMK